MLQFMGDHPLLTWCLAWSVWIIPAVVGTVLRVPLLMWSRLMRHRNIKAAGWPPEHLDADGDVIPLTTAETVAD